MAFANHKKGCPKAYAWGVFVWAFLVSLSRVFMAKHFIGDILVGALAGLAIGFLMGFAARLICKRLAGNPGSEASEAGAAQELTKQ